MEQHATPFQLGNHEDAPETGMQEELQALKLEKLGNRVALLAVLIPCLVGVLLAIGYLDVRNRIKHAHASEAAGMEQLAADLDARMAAFTREQAQTKDAQAQKAADLETSIAAVQAGLEATASLLDQYAAAGISRQELSRELAALDEKNRAAADSLEIEIEALKLMGSRTADNVEGASGDLHALAESLDTLEKGLARLNKDLAGLSAEKIGKKELDLALKLKQMSNRQELLKFQAALEKRLDHLEKHPQKLKAAQGQTVAVQTIKGNKQSKEKPAQSATNASAEAIEEQSLE